MAETKDGATEIRVKMGIKVGMETEPFKMSAIDIPMVGMSGSSVGTIKTRPTIDPIRQTRGNRIAGATANQKAEVFIVIITVVVISNSYNGNVRWIFSIYYLITVGSR